MAIIEGEKRLKVTYLCELTQEPMFTFQSVLDDTPPEVADCILHPDMMPHIAIMSGTNAEENETNQEING